MAHAKFNVSKNLQVATFRMTKSQGSAIALVKQGGVAMVSISKNVGTLAKQSKGP